MAKIVDTGDYSIVWLCPLAIETAAALYMLDELHEAVAKRQHGQTVEYHFGRIGFHNVAVVGFPSGEVGTAKAGTIAEAVIRDFKNLELGLLVGIGAAIPSQNRDIRLGDVAVADPTGRHPGIISYEMAKIGPDEELPKQWMEATHPLWRSVISKIKARAAVHGDTFQRHLTVFETPNGKQFQQPHEPPPLHVAFNDCVRDSKDPMVHYGSILSGNKVIKAIKFRDQLGGRFEDSVALEMEAAGIMTTLPVAVIRGISDAADHHKSDKWHGRAAAVAAAYAKEMLLQLSPRATVVVRRRSHVSHRSGETLRLKGQLPKPWEFFGREDHLTTIAKCLDRATANHFEKSIVVLSGLSGAGKSQIAAAYVKNQLIEDPDREVFWVNARDQKAFEKSVFQFQADDWKLQTAKDTQLAEDVDGKTADAVHALLEELNRPGHTGWLLVLDDIADWIEDEPFSAIPASLGAFLDQVSQGSILVTTNHQNWSMGQGTALRIGGLDEAAAVSLLRSKLHGHYTQSEELLQLATMLHCLPLSLRLAITYILKQGIRVSKYVEMWQTRKLDGTLSLVEPSLVQTMQLCFEKLESYNASAAKLLTLFGFLDHTNLSFDLVSNIDPPSFPGWLVALAKDEDAFHKAIEALIDLSFVQIANDMGEGIVYSIHPVVHTFARLQAGGLKQKYISLAVSLVADNVPRSLDKGFWQKAQALSTHADQCMSYVRVGTFRPQDLERIAALLRLLGRYDEASTLYKSVLQHLEPHRTVLGETIAQVLNDLGLVYLGQRNFDLAMKGFSTSMQIYLQLPTPLPNASLDTLMCISFNYGNACRMARNLKMAETTFNKVYEFFDHQRQTRAGQVPSWIELIFSRVLNALGELQLERNDTKKAINLFRRALTIQERILDVGHPVILSARTNLGRAYTDLESYAEACEMLTDVGAKYKDHFGADHEVTVVANDELARASMGHGQFLKEHDQSETQATERLRQAGELWTGVLAYYGVKYGSDSEDALRTKANIALLQSVNGDLDMARRNMLQVFQRTKFPAQKVKAQCDLALICQQMGDLRVAEINFDQAIEASKSLPEPARNQELFRSMYYQAQLYFAQRDQDRYMQVLENLSLQSEVEGNEWQQRAQSELQLGVVRRPDQSPLPRTKRKKKWQME